MRRLANDPRESRKLYLLGASFVGVFRFGLLRRFNEPIISRHGDRGTKWVSSVVSST